ncbi:energy transducer TonB [Chryseobacterium gwangjuense]|uniref:energy transducer TonB n=1 Tax=Chryseobacterium gwangjuense TaxID=1069980 RepID=UPI001E62BD05|nr:energy transducer TonB [Chryseobacterium gwangjuense]MCE3075231.1 energy transducer TonB [Chryseobacterium gwangjuense]
MNKTLIFILILGYHLALSQEQNASSNEIFETEQFGNVEKSKEFPIYPGGINVFKTNFAKLIDWDKVNAKGRVKSEAQLIISEDGSVTDINIVGDNKSLNKEMERVAKLMSKTKWIPAKIDGKPVKFRFKLPITMNFDE